MDSATTAKFYLDNGTAVTKAVTYSAVPSLSMLFGAQGIGGSRSIARELDEIKIYNGVLSAVEVRGLYTTNAIPEPTFTALFGMFGVLALLRRRRLVVSF